MLFSASSLSVDSYAAVTVYTLMLFYGRRM